MVKIYIDPGHGGNDPGAVANGLREKDLTLKIGLKLRDYLSGYENVQIRMSRTTDKTVSLSERTNDANKWGADLFVSIHINAGGGVGFESFVYSGNVSEATRANQNVIHQEIIRATGWNDRGKKRANFAVLRQTKMPALLTENGFIDNKADANKLKQDSFLDKIAKGHAEGIAAAFGLKKKASAKPAPSNAKTFYRVVTGSFADRKNAEKRVADLKKAGFDSFIDVYKK
jgi:N-acetylmuramoyl-L-alanine amidase